MLSVEEEERLVRDWSTAFTTDVLEYVSKSSFSSTTSTHTSTSFDTMYRTLVHSDAFSAMMMDLEAFMAVAMENKYDAVTRQRVQLAEEQQRRMSLLVRGEQPDLFGDDEELQRRVNRLAGEQLNAMQRADVDWRSQLDNLREDQIRDFKLFLKLAYRDHVKRSNGSLHQDDLGHESEDCDESHGRGVKDRPATIVSRWSSRHSSAHLSSSDAGNGDIVNRQGSLEESFTITLGAQMKQMHNLRVMATDLFELFSYPSNPTEAMPLRLQTAMSLYSNHLSGVVVLTDDSLSSSVSPMERGLKELCSKSTDFHFPLLEHQLEVINEEQRPKALKWRTAYRQKLVEEAQHQLGEEAAHEIHERYKNESTVLSVGDVFLTRHSNLKEAHVLFHVVTEGTLSPKMSSRHPVVLALRGVLKTASLNDVTTMSIPLLLTHHMTEEMTVAWCMRRAELVFKCVKGFMMEVSSWGGCELRTLQFIVPKEMDSELFHRITSMLASIFRTSNPIRE